VTEASHNVPRNYVGMPAALLLDDFGEAVRDAFGAIPYLVGSATQHRNWRDVDVRLILDDDEYERQGFGHPDHAGYSTRLTAMVKAFSVLAHHMTGLPVDFQIQQQSRADREHPDHTAHPRIPLYRADRIARLSQTA
jgi:hypothetical protein